MGTLDGNLYPIQFRLHDNRFPNSPEAKTVGGGALRSDLLSMAEPGYDPVRRVLSIGDGNQTGKSAVSGDAYGDLIASITPLIDSANHLLNHKVMSVGGLPMVEVSAENVAFTNSMIVNASGVDKAKFGYGYGAAAVNTLYNIQTLLKQILAIQVARATVGFDPPTLASMVAVANAGVNNLYSATGGADISRLPYHLPEVFGNYVNLLAKSEDFANAAWTKNTNLTVTADQILSPNGTNNADMIVDSDASLDVNLYQDITHTTDSQWRCFSTYLHAGTAHYSNIRVTTLGGTQVASHVTIDWSSGTPTIVTAQSTGVYGLMATNYPGWYFLYTAVQNNSSSGNTTTRSLIRPASGYGFSNTDTGYVYAWGAQLNYGRAPELYVAT